MIGLLTQPGDPTSGLHAAGKAYVDRLITLSYWKYIYYMNSRDYIQHRRKQRKERSVPHLASAKVMTWPQGGHDKWLRRGQRVPPLPSNYKQQDG